MNESPAIILLVLGTWLISWGTFSRPDLRERWLFRPERILADKESYRLLSSGFIHAGWGHLLLNLYALYGFGGVVAWAYGQGGLLLIYFGSVLGGNLVALYLHRHHDYAAYGASGGVGGIIFAYILEFPYSRMALFPLPYSVPAWLLALLFLPASAYALKAQRNDVGHDAHLGGALVGLFLAAALRPEAVREHWAVFGLLAFVGMILFLYFYRNPLFLPLSALWSAPRWPLRGSRPPRIRVERMPAKPSRPVRRRVTPAPPAVRIQTDWLLRQIEEQVGKLEKDGTGVHAWIDRFGRAYDLVKGEPATFDLDTFQAAILERLGDPGVSFVVVDTRPLREDQVALLRPFIANLPDRQFQRVLRSYGFKAPPEG